MRKKRSWAIVLSALAIFITSCLFLAFAGIDRFKEQQRPRSITSGNPVKFVKAGMNLQAAVNAAQAGDTLIVEAGATFNGPLYLPNKSGSSAITIQSSRLAELSADERVSALDSAKLFRIVSTNTDGAIKAQFGAHNYRLIGVEVTLGPTSPYIYNLIDISSGATQLAQLASFIEFDRCYIHSPGLNKARRGFAANGGDFTLKNSTVAGFAGVQDECQAVAGWGGTGPFHIINNYLEAATENILFGGSDPSIPNLIPSDIEIRRNFFTKQDSWNGVASVKNILELKNAQRVVIDGNIFEKGFNVTALVFTVRNQNNTAPWSTIKEVSVTNNTIRNSLAGVNILGVDNESTTGSVELDGLVIANNTFSVIDKWVLISGGKNIELRHNTTFNGGNLLTFYGRRPGKMIVADNILSWGGYGIVIDPSLNDAPLSELSVVNKNVFVKNSWGDPVSYPVNFSAPSVSAVGFKNYSAGDFSLLSSSLYHNAASDGRDLGCDTSALSFSTAGVDTVNGGAAAPALQIITSTSVQTLVNAQEVDLSNSQTAALNALNYLSGSFNVFSSDNFGPDKRTRVMLFATGITALAVNTDNTNDIRVSDQRIIANYSESVAVEARTASGQVFQLPVEFAGSKEGTAGLDQINFVLLPELQGAGNVEITIIVGGQRSNNAILTIK